MTVVGAAFGIGAALAAFHYDGSRPVNVVTILATLVFTQLVLLVLTLLLIPRGVPGLRAIQDLLASHQPGGARRIDLPAHRQYSTRRRAAVWLASGTRSGSEPIRKMATAILVADGSGRLQCRGDRNRRRAGNVHRSRVRLEHYAAHRRTFNRSHRRHSVRTMEIVAAEARCPTSYSSNVRSSFVSTVPERLIGGLA